MNDVAVIDRFLAIFAAYIDSGFGLLQGEVAFLTASLIVIDMTIAGVFWALDHATGQGNDVIAKLIRKVLYVGAFAYIINNFNLLAGIIFRSFAGLGLTATGTMTMENFLQPGRLAAAGLDAAGPIMLQIDSLTGFPDVFVNLTAIVVMFIAWIIVLLCFFVLAIQLFITLIEFKLTTLAGFVLVPFALWGKTAFLAEKVLGNVMSSGIKVLVLAVIVGIGTGLFAEFQTVPAEPSIDHALVVMLASLTLLALGIFGPGVATGLISGGPQLGAGSMAAATVGAAGALVGAGAAAVGAARMGPAAVQGAARMRQGYGVAAAGHSGWRRVAAGVGGAVRAARNPAYASAVGAAKAQTAEVNGGAAGGAVGAGAQPAWAKRLQRRQRMAHAATTAAHALRSGDSGSGGASPRLATSD